MLPDFDFTEALALNVDERIRVAMERAREVVVANGYARIGDYPCVPDSRGTLAELDELERRTGAPLPPEYRAFLEHYRYLMLDDGYNIGGLSHDGVHYGEGPWLSNEHPTNGPALVFGFYWRYADGDQLLIPLDDPSHPVLAYFHEVPVVEPFAPSFSLALWRLVSDGADAFADDA